MFLSIYFQMAQNFEFVSSDCTDEEEADKKHYKDKVRDG